MLFGVLVFYTMDLYKFLTLVQDWLLYHNNLNLELVVLETYEGTINKNFVVIFNVTEGNYVGPPDIKNISLVRKIFQRYPIDRMHFLKLQYNELLLPEESGSCSIIKYWVVFYKTAVDV